MILSEFLENLTHYFGEKNLTKTETVGTWLGSQFLKEVELDDLFNRIIGNETFFPFVATIKKYLCLEDHSYIGFREAQKIVSLSIIKLEIENIIPGSVTNLGYIIPPEKTVIKTESHNPKIKNLDHHTQLAIIVGWGDLDSFKADTQPERWKIRQFEKAWEATKYHTAQSLQKRLEGNQKKIAK